MNPLNLEKIDWETNVSIGKKKLQMNLPNVEKIDSQTNVSIRKKKLQMNPLNVEKIDWQTNLSIRKKKLEMNLLNVEKIDCQTNVSIRKKKIPSESAECRQKRLLTQQQYRKNIATNSTITDEIREFHAVVSRGPLYICSCCDQLWYKHSVVSAEKLRLSNPNAGIYLLSKTSVDDIHFEWICQSCNNHLTKNKIPPCATKNGMSFSVKPDFFYLNELECRLLAPRLAFQKLMQAPRGNQLKIKGNIVNVPADFNNTANVLPRLPQESGTVKVQLKRRLQYKSSVLSLNVRPYKKKKLGQ